jgi:hypothetical protein
MQHACEVQDASIGEIGPALAGFRLVPQFPYL